MGPALGEGGLARRGADREMRAGRALIDVTRESRGSLTDRSHEITVSSRRACPTDGSWLVAARGLERPLLCLVSAGRVAGSLRV